MNMTERERVSRVDVSSGFQESCSQVGWVLLRAWCHSGGGRGKMGRGATLQCVCVCV